MGVYIPNMEKPKHCTECYFVCRDQCELQDNSYDYDTFKEQKKHCPLIEIGDIQYKAFLEFNEKLIKKLEEHFLYGERRTDETQP